MPRKRPVRPPHVTIGERTADVDPELRDAVIHAAECRPRAVAWQWGAKRVPLDAARASSPAGVPDISVDAGFRLGLLPDIKGAPARRVGSASEAVFGFEQRSSCNLPTQHH